MTSIGASSANRRGSRAVNWLLAAVLLLGVAHSARSDDCSDFPGGVLDGAAGTVPPVQLNIDQDCRVQNYTQANPFDSNVNFDTDPGNPNSQAYLIIFNNVYFTGQMSCNDNHIHNHRLWFTNGTIATNLQPQCRDLFIPVEKIDKQNPAGQTTATIGVPFTYTHTMPVMWDPITGTIINDQGSLDDLHGVTVIDDLNESAAQLTYVSHAVHWEGSGTPLVEGTDYSFTNVGGRLTWDFGPFDTIIPAGEQIVIELTVVLDDDPANVNGLQFINTARWDFGRLIDGVFYEPLPGENGITPPMTIAAPELVVTKTGPATMNIGEWGDFVIDVANVRPQRCLGREPARPLPGRRDGRHVRPDARDPERASVRRGRSHSGTGQARAESGQRLFPQLQRRAVLRAQRQHADARRRDRPERAADRPLPDPARRGHAERRGADQRGRCDPRGSTATTATRIASRTRAR